MARFLMTNRLLPADHAAFTATVDSDSKAFARIVSRLAGAGLSVEHTAKAMALGQELKDLPLGESREFKKAPLYDLVVIRLPD